MVRGIIWAVVVVLLVVGGWLVYRQIKGGDAMTSGDVTSRTVNGEKTETAYTDLDGTPGRDAKPTPSRSDAPGTVNGDAVGSGTQTTAPQATTTYNSAAPAPNASTPMMAAPNAALPVSDTIAPNAPNGLAFGGTGKYQWYRQGNLTWRVDTGSGSSCIAFATDEEWRKPRVYSHGCGNA